MINSFVFFMTMLMWSTLFCICSTSWFSVWMGLEMNMMMFIPLMNKKSNSLCNESSLKYFLIQSSASTFFLLGSLLNSMAFHSPNNMILNLIINSLIMSSLMLKIGSAPFHNWILNIVEGLSWFKNFLLMTWQKIAPLFILSYCHMNTKIILLFIFSSATFGSLGGLGQTSLRKMMTYSSISHLSWIFCNLIYSNYMTLLYFLSYIYFSSMVMFMFHSSKIFYLNQMFLINKSHTLLILTSLFSLGGLPPFPGFIPKWMTLTNLMKMNINLLSLILVMSSLITLFFYMKIIFSPSLILALKQKTLNLNPMNFMLLFNFLNSLTLFGFMLFMIMN